MRTAIYITTLILISLLSCDREPTIVREDISFTFHKDINKASQEILTTNILRLIKEFNFSEFNQIKKIKIDTILYSYVFSIPFTDSLTKNSIDRFKGFAAVLSDYELNGESIHIKLTDNDFNLIKSLQFDRDAYDKIQSLYESNKISIKTDKSVPEFQPGGLSFILLNRIPSLFTSKDTLLMNITMEKEDIKVDMTINLSEISTESVKEEFKKIDPLYFYGLFDNRTIYFQLRDKKDAQLRAVYTLEKI